jgi:hypothetical protein
VGIPCSLLGIGGFSAGLRTDILPSRSPQNRRQSTEKAAGIIKKPLLIVGYPFWVEKRDFADSGGFFYGQIETFPAFVGLGKTCFGQK